MYWWIYHILADMSGKDPLGLQKLGALKLFQAFMANRRK